MKPWLAASFLFLATAAHGEVGTCPVPAAFEDSFFDFSRQIVRQVEKESFRLSPSQYCDEQLALRYLFAQSRKAAPLEKIREALETGKLEALLREVAAPLVKFSRKVGGTSKWERSLIPLPETRLRPLQNFAKNFGVSEETMTLEQAIAVLDQAECTGDSFPPLKDDAESFGNKARRDIENLPFGGKEAVLADSCKDLVSPFAINQCRAAFEPVLRIAAGSTQNSTGAEIFERVYSDARYRPGLVAAAKTLAKKAMSGQAPDGDLFSDVKKSFAENAASEAEAEEFAWNTIALVATSGPNIEGRIASLITNDGAMKKTSAALAIIGNSLPILDHRSSAAGQLYSFPPSVKGSCNTGKSYHFWYTAYLARRAAQESGSVEGGASAAFIAEKAYQVLNRAELGNKVGKILDGALYTPAAAIVRADLAYAGAGAVFGANAAAGKMMDLDVDAGILEMQETAGTGSPSMMVKLAARFVPQAKGYRKWIEFYNPDAAFLKFASFEEKAKRSYLEIEGSAKPVPSCY